MKRVIKLTESDLKRIIHESVINLLKEDINEREIDEYIDMRASNKRIMDNIIAKYQRLYGSMIFDYPDMSSFFDAMMEDGESIPVKDILAYEDAKKAHLQASNILSKYKEDLKMMKPSFKDEIKSGNEWPYHDLYNRI